MTRHGLLIALAVISTLTFAASSPAQDKPDVLGLIDRAVKEAEFADEQLILDLRSVCTKEPERVTQAILPRLRKDDASAAELAFYVWALGEARARTAVPAIVAVYDRSTERMVQGNCLRALSLIGGEDAENFLIKKLDASKEEGDRYQLLNLLAEMKSKGAITRAAYLLELPATMQWKPMFVYGKLGEKAVPSLLEKMAAKQTEVRKTAVALLGNWIMPADVSKHFQRRYWQEPDTQVRLMLIGAIEQSTEDIQGVVKFCQEVVAKEKDPQLVEYARETVANGDKVLETFRKMAADHKPDAQAFQREYELLLNSTGKDGDYAVLRDASSVENEAALRRLREVILQRGSDEAFVDYMKINQTIQRNRSIAALRKE